MAEVQALLVCELEIPALLGGEEDFLEVVGKNELDFPELISIELETSILVAPKELEGPELVELEKNVKEAELEIGYLDALELEVIELVAVK